MSLAAMLVFAWLLGAIGVYHVGIAAYALLAVAVVLVASVALRRRV